MEWPALHESIVDLVGRLRRHPPRSRRGSGSEPRASVDRTGRGALRAEPAPLIRVPLREILTQSLGLPVVVDNDANVAAWGELCHGAARGIADGLVITLGTGVGGGIITDGRVMRGAHGFRRRGRPLAVRPARPDLRLREPGHWETAASGSALGQLARTRALTGDAPNVLARAGGDVSKVTGVHVGESAAAGEPDGRDLLAAYARQVALGFAGSPTSWTPSSSSCPAAWSSSATCSSGRCGRRSARTSRGGGTGRRSRSSPAALGERAGVVGAAGALARDLVR